MRTQVPRWEHEPFQAYPVPTTVSMLQIKISPLFSIQVTNFLNLRHRTDFEIAVYRRSIYGAFRVRVDEIAVLPGSTKSETINLLS